MPIEYPIFTAEPDFNTPPKTRSLTKADLLQLSPSPDLVTWPDTRTETSVGWTFAWKTRKEAAAARDFWTARGGKHEVFLLPSWERDYDLAALPGIGATALVLAGDFTAVLVDTLPDTPGRYLFIRDPSGGLATMRVISATYDGLSSTSTLTIEPALPFGITDGAMVGNLLLARFDDDELTFRFTSEDTGTVDLSFRTVLERSAREQHYALDGDQVYQSLGFVVSDQVPGARPILRNDTAYATGPTNLHVVQSDPYATRWAVWLGSTALRIGRAADDSITPPYDGFGQPSQLFPTGKPNTTHITLAFDQTSREVVAWQDATTETVHLRRWNNGVVVNVSWPGKSPALFFNGTIAKQARIDGETDIAVYYIRTGQNLLFMRMERDNFLTEYVGNPAPGKPLVLLRSTEITGFIHEITALDSGFRVMKVRTPAYPQPIHVEPVSPFVTLEPYTESVVPSVSMSGDYHNVIRDGGVWPEVVNIPVVLFGAYTSEIISPPGPLAEAASVGVGLSGSYDNVSVPPQTTGEQLTIDPLLFGAYTLAVITVSPITETMNLAPLLSGSYDQVITNPQTATDAIQPSVSLSGSYGP